ncbi:hypothetical protein STHU_40580 [Allostella humosa]|nr:hypothetical protein STHU_40580 [Stella humosa]
MAPLELVAHEGTGSRRRAAVRAIECPVDRHGPEAAALEEGCCIPIPRAFEINRPDYSEAGRAYPR